MEKETISQKLERFDSEELRTSLLFACMAGVVFIAMAIMAARQDYGWLLPLGFFFVIFGMYSLTFLAYARGWRTGASGEEETEEEETPVIAEPLTPRTDYVQGPKAHKLNEQDLLYCLSVRRFVDLILKADPNNLTEVKKMVEGKEYDTRMNELAKLGIVNGGQGVRTRMLLVREPGEIWRRINAKAAIDIPNSIEMTREINARGKVSYTIRDSSSIENSVSNFI